MNSLALMTCLRCRAPLSGSGLCRACGATYLNTGGIVEAIGPLRGRNRVAADFYGGKGWSRFRPWERAFLALMGGNRRARGAILRHLDARPPLRMLEVGIGDGENLQILPPGVECHGVDLCRARLEDCLRRFPAMSDRLVLAEAERLPFPESTFDACLCVGGFTFFDDHGLALREMRRVTRPEGPVIVADEVPWLCRLGLPQIDAAWLRLLGLPGEFITMAFDLRLDLDAVVRDHLRGAVRERIWAGLGYCLVDRPDAVTAAIRHAMESVPCP